VPLEPFEIAGRMDGVEVLDRPAVVAVIGESCAGKLFGCFRDAWSGFVLPVGGRHLIVVNDTHPATRQRATLTEELFHIVLGHRPSEIYVCPATGLLRRAYAPGVEREAYGSAAAALLPYATLRDLLQAGGTIESIAESFGVSVPLVEFRMKVTKLWRRRGS
jgi:hypothetical protein